MIFRPRPPSRRSGAAAFAPCRAVALRRRRIRCAAGEGWREWRGSNPLRIVDYQGFRWGALTNSLTKASHAQSRPGASSRCLG